MSISERMLQAWYSGHPLLILLRPLEWLYRWVVGRRRRAFVAGRGGIYRAPVPIIVVRNITLGGTGKTPMAIWLLEHYLAQGKTPAYLSRGYGRKTSGYLQVSPGHRSRDVGDEALMVALRVSASMKINLK